jgi:hypothetical protein
MLAMDSTTFPAQATTQHERAGAVAPNSASMARAAYVAIGDSYASGEGSFSYLAGTDENSNECHRAKRGYAEQLPKSLAMSLRFAACSGAVISDLYETDTVVAKKYYGFSPAITANVGQAKQLSNLSSATKLVTLSIGGNSAGFAPLLTDCVFGSGIAHGGTTGRRGCESRDKTAALINLSYLKHGRKSGKCTPYYPKAEKGGRGGFCGAEPALASVYETVAKDAPNAAVYIVGYPNLFGHLTKTCRLGGGANGSYWITASDANWINTLSVRLDGDIAAATAAASKATGRTIRSINPAATFKDHGICDTGAPWINRLDLDAGGLGNGHQPESESFHPNVTGQNALYSLISKTIAATRIPVITTTHLPTGTVGQPYSAELTTADHRTGTWAITSGKLPAGLSPSGHTITGTPTTAGTSTFRLTFSDNNHQTAKAAGSIVVDPARGSGPWIPMKTPLPANAGGGPSVLRSVACGAVASCAAVGIYTDNNGLIQGLIDTSADSTWTSVEAPLPGNAFNDGVQFAPAGLTSVACATANSCVAIGNYTGFNGDTGLIDTLSEGTWTAAEAPLPLGAPTVQQNLNLSAVACPAVGSCVVVGRYTDDAGNGQGLIDTLSGGVWSSSVAPLPAGATAAGIGNAGVGLESVACGAAGSCTAVGDYDVATDNGLGIGLIDTLSDGTWSPTEAPEPTNAEKGTAPTINSDPGPAVACGAADSCTVIGQYTDNNNNVQGLFDALTDGAWTTTEAPVPNAFANTGPGPYLESVACGAAGSCNAIGETGATGLAVVYASADGAWTATPEPVPPGVENVSVQPVACGPPGNCTAVGQEFGSTDFDQGLIDTLLDGNWSTTEPPLPATAPASSIAGLASVAYDPDAARVAVGYYSDDNNIEQGLIETSSA